MYDYQKSGRYFAQVSDDVKDLAAKELLKLGAFDICPVFRGIYFNADKKTLYKINLYARIINRVLAQIKTFSCHSDKYLYKTAKQIEWIDFISEDKTFNVFANVSKSKINHTKFAALRLKDAIVDYFREKRGKRPSVDRRNADLWLNVHIDKNIATISIDVSGGSLHRRGYRTESIQAPMSETLAASILHYSEWNGKETVYDPFCGSGTILCEAYLLASNTPPALNRAKFGFESLPDFDNTLWNEVKGEAAQNITSIESNIINGSDVDKKIVQIAKKNFANIDPQQKINIAQKDIFDIEKLENTTIICNPPYGIRMKDKINLDEFYKNIGDFLKQRCKNSTAYIYFGDREQIKKIGLRSSKKWILSNGGLDGRLVKYEMY